MSNPGCATLTAGAASAHVTFEQGKAPVGSTYKAVLRIPHGCDGSATSAVRIKIPEGVIAVKPQPKAGWSLTKVKGAYGKSYDYNGAPVPEGIKEIAWSGGNLGDDEYDEFVFRGYLAASLKPGETLYFPVVQECLAGKIQRWIEIPAAGQSDDDLEFPAPSLRLEPKSVETE